MTLPAADSAPPQAGSLLAATAPESPGTWSQTFAATSGQVRHARQGLAAFLHGWALEQDAIACLSELVTNAIQHSESGKPGGTVTVSALLTKDWLHVAVQDQGGPWRPAAQPSCTDQRGQGLQIVAALAYEWGKAAAEGSRTVWFTMKLPGPAQPPATGEES